MFNHSPGSRFCFAALAAVVLLIALLPVIAFATDPTGAETGTAADITAADPGHPTPDELAQEVGHNKISINYVWLLLCGFLVMFMQAGFAMLEVGFVRAKNAVHTMMMNMVIYGLGVLGFFFVGYAIMFGGAGPFAALGGGGSLANEFTINLFGKPFGLFGTTGFAFAGHYDVAIFAMFLFQVVFMDAMATIPTGAMAERWRFANFCLYGLAASMLIYPIFGNWVWGGGWLAKLGTNFGLGNGFCDFAGSSVVHAVGGLTALVGAYLLGPRIGKFDKKTKAPRAIPGHDIPIAILGAYILAFGWFGFNAGSTLAGGDIRLAVVATNTMLASAAGMIAAMMFMLKLTKKFDAPMSANGFLAGLVAITAPCAFVPAWAALIIGLVAGLLVCVVVIFVERVLHIDDPVGAVAVHGANGLWGCLALGIFADGTYGGGFNGVEHTVRGLLFGGTDQFVAQLIGIVTVIIYTLTMSFIVFKVLNVISPMRSKPEDELAGLDMPETGITAYPDFDLTHTS